MTKQFLLQVQMGDGSRFDPSEGEVIAGLEYVATVFIKGSTQGPIPSAKFVQLLDAEQLDLLKLPSIILTK